MSKGWTLLNAAAHVYSPRNFVGQRRRIAVNLRSVWTKKKKKIKFKTSLRHIAKRRREDNKQRPATPEEDVSCGEDTRIYHTCDLLVALKIY